jgi:hypothetical protein
VLDPLSYILTIGYNAAGYYDAIERGVGEVNVAPRPAGFLKGFFFSAIISSS